MERNLPKRIFSYREALATFPKIQRLTSSAVRRIEAMVNGLQSREEMEARKGELEAAYQEIVDQWTLEIQAEGCEVKGLWLVDWDTGAGYYCWRYPEVSLAHFHGYEEGFDGRVPIN